MYCYIGLAYVWDIIVANKLTVEDQTAVLTQYSYAPIKCTSSVLGQRLIEGEKYNEKCGSKRTSFDIRLSI